MEELQLKGKKAKQAQYALAKLSPDAKNNVLLRSAEALIARQTEILAANQKDLAAATENGVKGALIDRLTLTADRIENMAEGLRQIVALEDPIGEVLSMRTLPNGLQVGKRRVPMGVIGIIYEARPNVTVDAFGLCFKSGNVTILRGGKEAINSNMAVVSILRETIKACNAPEDALQLVEDTTRESAVALMKLNEYLDLLIPRGGAGLIQTVVKNSSVPVIETGVGNCHVFVDASADIDKAVAIAINSKTHRPGVCNAAENLLVHKSIAAEFLPIVAAELRKYNVEMRVDAATKQYIADATDATEEDWATEFLDYILAIKTVESVDEAITHINKYGTMHSECIVTENYSNSQRFLDEIDAAAVYINASTRFTDGMEFGFGAEIGISTQKLHARGPLGLKELTSSKYIIYGNGQIRK